MLFEVKVMEYAIYIEFNGKGELAYIIPVKSYKDCKLVDSGFGTYEFEKGIEVVKQNGNMVIAHCLDSKEQAQEIKNLLLSKGLPEDQIDPSLTLA